MIILIILIIVLLLSLFLINKTLKKKETILDEVKLQENITKKDGFALMLQQEDGTYKENESSSWPNNMKFNTELSGCMDANGNKIENSLSFDSTTNLVTLKTNQTSYCYVYFDIDNSAASYLIENISSDVLWNSTLEEDGYRYVGTNPDNYICFGTSDENECTSNPDKYMYRIIGIFEDNNGNKHTKLIKKEALNTKCAWTSDNQTDINWNESDLYKVLNGSYFLTNTSYSYMQDSTWTSKIAKWNYTMTNTITYKSSGIDYYYNSAKKIYLHELNKSGKSDGTCYHNSSTTAGCDVGKWEILNAKISLMYASDYALSLGSVALNYIGSFDELQTGWMFLSNNDSSAPSNDEWTMSRSGIDYGTYHSWFITSEGSVDGYGYVDNLSSARPVFYLESDVEYDGGTGTIDNPLMITSEEDNSAAAILINTVSSDVLWSSTLEDDGYRYVGTDPNNYICFGTTNKDNCTNDPDTYMFRIIGVFEDSENNKHLKLIKNSKLKTLLGNSTEEFTTSFVWDSRNKSDTDWNNSDLYNGLNGSYFWSPSLYTYTYMYDETEHWKDKIATWNYTMTNTKYSESNGLSYYYNKGKVVYLHELNRNDKLNQICYRSSSDTTECSIGEWKSVNAKIGLMYASDNLLSLGSEALSYTSSSNYRTLETGWMRLSDNNEWTMTRIGRDGTYYHSVYSSIYGGINTTTVDTTYHSIRPVFYLNSDVKFAENSGNGSITNPYMILE